MKAWKIFLGIGISVVVLGVVVFLIGLGLNGWKLSVEYEMHTYRSKEDNATLDLGLSAGEMNVVFYDGDVIEVEYPDSFRFGYDVEEKNGTLRVAPRPTFSIWFGWNRIPAVTVKIPQGKVLNLNLDLSAGTAKVASGRFGKVNASMSAGWLNFGDIKCTDFVSDTSAGKLDVSALECFTINLDMSAGVANVNKIVCDKINVDLSAGSANMAVSGKKSEYSVSVDKSAGSCNISNQTGTNGVKVIDVDLSAGSVNFVFTD